MFPSDVLEEVRNLVCFRPGDLSDPREVKGNSLATTALSGPLWEPKFFQLSQWDGSSKGICQVSTLLIHHLLRLKASLMLSLPRSAFKLLVNYLWKPPMVLSIIPNTYICSQILGDCSAVLLKLGATSLFGGIDLICWQVGAFPSCKAWLLISRFSAPRLWSPGSVWGHPSR